MTLGRLSVMSWIHTPERQPKSQLAMPFLHMAVTICLSRKSPDTNTPSLLPRILTVCIHLLLLMDFIIVYCCFVECPDFSLGENLHVCVLEMLPTLLYLSTLPISSSICQLLSDIFNSFSPPQTLFLLIHLSGVFPPSGLRIFRLL